MAGIRVSLGRAGYDLLSQAVTRYAREKGDGGLRVSGRPGGVVHLRDGLVVAVASPGAPGPGTLLMRSGRSGAGVAGMRVVRVMAMQDAAFAIVAGHVDGCEPLDDPVDPPDALAVGEVPARLLHQVARKLAALDVLSHPVRPDRERPLPAIEVDLTQLGEVQRDLLIHADGRRTARDIAFRTGRAVYTVTVEMARLLGAGYLECVESVAPPVRIPVRMPPEGLRPRTPPAAEPAVARAAGAGAPATSSPPPPPPPPPPPGPGPALPRRRPGASGITETLASDKNGASWKGFFRLRSGTAK
ncbi:MarR family transcriptional regulator [Streptomyces yaanensis]|uniref:MarR family transcriptional regulator n=1 Tax=Streptomyces yaanensis TaxID=1142239 RepID=A0ABV7SG07_9ACTN|nr:MarR family transcriptional regulator [Streptomyces sp. CGMCC 4.7035]WNB97516.1 MarR family transcriptional regulator [Streptomyces sp. CGMCC 4.7035]